MSTLKHGEMIPTMSMKYLSRWHIQWHKQATHLL